MKKLILSLLLAVAVNGFAQVKVSELPSADSVGLDDVVPLVVGSQTKKATIGQVADAVVGRRNPYTGSFTGGSVFAEWLTVSDGTSLPYYGPFLASIGAN